MGIFQVIYLFFNLMLVHGCINGAKIKITKTVKDALKNESEAKFYQDAVVLRGLSH